MNPRWSTPQAIAMCLASLAAFALMGAAIATYLYDKLIGGQP